MNLATSELLWGVRDLLKRKRAQFRSVRLEEFDDSMPFREQLAVIARTQIFIGAHGAGLTHLNYLPAGACVVEVEPRFERTPFLKGRNL